MLYLGVTRAEPDKIISHSGHIASIKYKISKVFPEENLIITS